MPKSEEIKYFDFTLKPGQEVEKEYMMEKVVKPLINIITIYSNSNIELNETFNAILNQTFPYWEWNIINTCNEKETEKKLSELAQKDIRINLHNMSEISINEKIEKIDIDFIFILKPEDVLDRTTLECSYWSLKTNPQASWCYSNYVVNQEKLENKTFFSEEEKIKNIVNSSYLIRKQDFLEVGGYHSQDWILFLKLLGINKFPVRMDFYGSWNKEKNTGVQPEEISKHILGIKNKIMGINYPVGGDYWFNTQPYKSNWDKPYEKNNDKNNLLFIFPWFRVGGADKFNYDLISNLSKEKYNITIITTEPCPYICRQKFEKYAEIFDLTSFLHREHWATFIHYIIKTRDVKLVMNSNSYYGYYVIPWLKYQFPEVIFTDYLHAVNWNWRNGEYPKDSTAISRLLDKTFVTSNQVKDVMLREMGRKLDNTEVVYIGVDDQKFKENNPEIVYSKDLLENKEKYNNKKIILFCSRISREKRPILMVRILEELNKKRNDIVLFVVGDGPELEEMKQKTKQLNLQENVIFFGMQNDVRQFYKIADVLVVCSIREGITLTTYESLAMSTPVVSADVGGQKELIKDSCGRIVQNIQKIEDGENVKEYDIEEIRNYANAIIEIIDNTQYNEMKENCRRMVEEKFSIHKMVKKMEDEFEKLIQMGTTIPEKIMDNEELYKQYLLMYNEIDRRFYNSPKGGILPEPEETAEQKLKKQLEEEIIKLNQQKEQIGYKDMRIENLEKEISDIYNSKRWKYINKMLKFFGK